MKKIEAYGSTKNGVHRISYRDEFIEQWKELGDCQFRITIDKLYKKRSVLQNNFYQHVILHEFCNGYYETSGERITRETAHEFLKGKFNSKEVTINGSLLLIPQTTSTMTTTEFNEYVEHCRKFVGEFFGINIPEPGEQSEMEFHEKPI